MAGSRILLNQELTQKVLTQALPIQRWSLLSLLRAYRQKQLNRFCTLLRLPLGLLRYAFPKKWSSAKGCNLAMWKKDLFEVNGFDESYSGWGYEDSDLLIRLLHQGIRRKSGKFSVPILHLWHPQSDRSREAANYQRLTHLLKSKKIRAEKGLQEHA